jgi:hypothetical protein
MILTEFKNYDKSDIGPQEVAETSGHLPRARVRLALIGCSKRPTASAYRCRNTIYSEEKKLILFVTTADLREMLDTKGRGEDHSDFILDSIEDFYLQHD